MLLVLVRKLKPKLLYRQSITYYIPSDEIPKTSGQLTHIGIIYYYRLHEQFFSNKDDSKEINVKLYNVVGFCATSARRLARVGTSPCPIHCRRRATSAFTFEGRHCSYMDESRKLLEWVSFALSVIALGGLHDSVNCYIDLE